MSSLDVILSKAKQLQPLEPHEISRLMALEGPEQQQQLFDAALEVKEKVFGKRILLFAPVYISNECINDCLYCGFRRSNTQLIRRTLSVQETVEEARRLEKEGHRRLLLVSGEKPRKDLVALLEKIIIAVKQNTLIRSIQVNPPPLSVDECQRLSQAGYGNYQVFQETYHWLTYRKVHLTGPKRVYQWRLESAERAVRAGWNSIGMGILLGIFDYRYEIISLLSHVRYLENKFGIGPRTISLPRLRPALGAPLQNAPAPVSDGDFLKLLAILRLAVPYAEVVLSTRESSALRDRALKVGISQMSAGSHTSPGGYSNPAREENESQFYIADHRPLNEIVRELLSGGYLPSFSTVEDGFCQITMKEFIQLSRQGRIRQLVTANGVRSLEGYLEDPSRSEIKSIWLEKREDQFTGLSDGMRREVCLSG
ncbi:MAG: [FeFe] hydrogenase H-cluster radical SAM maturase HydG [Candidatus Omnitrophica bacterium]|nr:[FeFe] hydrogenase H-cluster radical SAM maturase HydG [Candidatus Omnitrophota bacterium]